MEGVYRKGNQLRCEMLHCSTPYPVRTLLHQKHVPFRQKEIAMSRQLTISSLFSALALVTLALFARAGDHAPGGLEAQAPQPAALVQTMDGGGLTG